MGVVVLLLAAATAIGPIGCRGGNRDPVIVRIGNSTIKKSALARRIAAIAPEQLAPQPPRYTACIRRQETLTLGAAKAVLKGECERQYEMLRRRALNFLISSRWLIKEASSRGLRISAREVEGRVRTNGSDSPVAGVAREDAAFQARAELCALQLRQVLRKREPKVTRRQVVDYYRGHIGRFVRQELRYVDLAENFVSASAAKRAREKVEAGASLAKISLREVLERFNLTGRERQRRSAQEAIFAAKPHALSGPIKLNSTYTIFEVTRVVPPKRTSFARVRRSIQRQLEHEQQRRSLARFIGSWRAKWIARTDCARGFVVELCRQHGDAKRRTVPSTFGGGSAEGLPVELLEKA